MWSCKRSFNRGNIYITSQPITTTPVFPSLEIKKNIEFVVKLYFKITSALEYYKNSNKSKKALKSDTIYVKKYQNDNTRILPF